LSAQAGQVYWVDMKKHIYAALALVGIFAIQSLNGRTKNELVSVDRAYADIAGSTGSVGTGNDGANSTSNASSCSGDTDGGGVGGGTSGGTSGGDAAGAGVGGGGF
jgi:hypothetical protein